MKVIVTGASGLVGRDLTKLLTYNNISWVGTFNSNPCDNLYKVDFNDEHEVNLFFETHMPTICINCIAERNVDLCETNWGHAKRVNIKTAEIIAKVCSSKNVFMIHISTDYVFGGTTGTNLPNSQTNPLQNYGISKYIAEKRVIEYSNGNYAIIRVPVLYTSDTRFIEETAIGLIAKKVLNFVDESVEDDLNIRRPVFIPDLCNFILGILKTNKKGIYHFYNPYDVYTKYKIAKEVASYLNKPLNVKPVIPKVNSERPYDTRLEDKSYNIDEYKITSLKDAIPKCYSYLYHPAILFDKAPDESVFLLIDLDGTLIDTDLLHFEAYQKAFNECNITISYDDYNTRACINDYVKSMCQNIDYSVLKNRKNEILKTNEKINFIKGAEELISWISKFEINHAVVTNTSYSNAEFFRMRLPLLSKLTNWVTREDTVYGKPSSEPYQKALDTFYKGERYTIGIENTISGVKSLSSVTKCIYVVCHPNTSIYKDIKKLDAYIIPSLDFLKSSVPK